MAPRGRKPRQRRNDTRMDGAIDSMTKTFGFSDEQLIRDVVNQLLEAYDGEWFFIEENSYRVLLDALLEKEGENSGQRDKLPENDQEDAALIETASIEAENSNANASTDDDEPTCVIAELPRRKKRNKDEEKSMAWKDINMDYVADQPTPLPLPRPPSPPPPPPAAGLFPRQRRPCYGWIDSDEEDGDDAFIELEPAAALDDLKPTERKSRWDLKPEDP